MRQLLSAKFERAVMLPFLAFCFLIRIVSLWPPHHALNVPFHALFVKTIKLQSGGRWWAGTAGPRYTLDSIESMDEDSV
jgi:hypothetical protein